ncbi:MAG: M15 family metallopeptidase [Flavobacteriaceae bacterium]|nr:M15 family metallopeptidase [Flavobacteriaceae bacterium]
MNRNLFLNITSLTGLGIVLNPSFAISPIQNKFTRNQLIGKGNPDISGDSYTSTMHKETAKALAEMSAAALDDNIKIEVVSAYRSFQRQKEIFENKYDRYIGQGLSPTSAIEKIIEYSTIPGTSRHHWGTDLDLIDANAPRPESVLMAENYHGKGPFCKFKEWMHEHAESFGFYEVYTNNANRKGFKYEPWHFSFAEVSIPMLQEYKKLDLKSILLEEKVKGSEHFTDAFISQYRKQNILDINPQLLS